MRRKKLKIKYFIFTQVYLSWNKHNLALLFIFIYLCPIYIIYIKRQIYALNKHFNFRLCLKWQSWMVLTPLTVTICNELSVSLPFIHINKIQIEKEKESTTLSTGVIVVIISRLTWEFKISQIVQCNIIPRVTSWFICISWTCAPDKLVNLCVHSY